MKNETKRTITAFVDADGYCVLAGEQFNPYQTDGSEKFGNRWYQLHLDGYELDANFDGDTDEQLADMCAMGQLIVDGEWPSANEDLLGIDADEVETFRDVNKEINEGNYIFSDHESAQLSHIDGDDPDDVRANRADIIKYHFPQVAYAVRDEELSEESQRFLDGDHQESARI